MKFSKYLLNRIRDFPEHFFYLCSWLSRSMGDQPGVCLPLCLQLAAVSSLHLQISSAFVTDVASSCLSLWPRREEHNSDNFLFLPFHKYGLLIFSSVSLASALLHCGALQAPFFLTLNQIVANKAVSLTFQFFPLLFGFLLLNRCPLAVCVWRGVSDHPRGLLVYLQGWEYAAWVYL